MLWITNLQNYRNGLNNEYSLINGLAQEYKISITMRVKGLKINIFQGKGCEICKWSEVWKVSGFSWEWNVRILQNKFQSMWWLEFTLYSKRIIYFTMDKFNYIPISHAWTWNASNTKYFRLEGWTRKIQHKYLNFNSLLISFIALDLENFLKSKF